jgi:hypothetical protein
MKVLYFTAISILFSPRYINSSPKLNNLFRSKYRTTLQLFDEVPFDLESARALAKSASDSGYLLYPIDSNEMYSILIRNNVFHKSELAKDPNLSLHNYRVDDDHHLRRLILHSNIVGVSRWNVIGDIDTSFSELVNSRYLKTDYEQGLTQDLLLQIAEL